MHCVALLCAKTVACSLSHLLHLFLTGACCAYRLECLERLGDEDGIWVWKRINALFNWLPLAALIEGKILCMHGGIGRCINRIEQIAELERPITMEVSKAHTTAGCCSIRVVWQQQGQRSALGA